MIKLLRPFNWGGKVIPEETICSFPPEIEKMLIENQNAEQFEPQNDQKPEKETEKEPDKEPEKEPDKKQKPYNRKGRS